MSSAFSTKAQRWQNLHIINQCHPLNATQTIDHELLPILARSLEFSCRWGNITVRAKWKERQDAEQQWGEGGGWREVHFTL